MTSYEMLWDCQFCGTKRLLGVTHRHCPACGAAQDPAARYFPEPGQEIEVKNHAYAGADWVCAACATPNGTRAAFCVNCGNGKDGAKSVALKVDGVATGGGSSGGGTAKTSKGPPPSQPRANPPVTPSRARRPLLVGIAGIALAAAAVFIFYVKARNVAVQAHSWARSIDVEQLYESRETAECSSMPGGAELRRRFSEDRTRRVADGEDCHEVCRDVRVDQGDGSFRKEQSCSESCSTRYRTEHYTVAMCEFDVGRWRKIRQAKVGGDGLDPAPAWPRIALRAGSGPKGFGKEREGERRESYGLTVRDDGGTSYSCDFDEPALWSRIKDGDTVIVDFDIFGNPRCGSIKQVTTRK